MMTKKQTNKNYNTVELGNKLHKQLVERAKLQQKQEEVWRDIKRVRDNRYSAKLNQIDNQIGCCTHEIDVTIATLIRVGGKSTKAHKMAISYLKHEIARNQRIASSREKLVHQVEAGVRQYINDKGITHTDTRSQRAYVAKKKQKIAEHQKMLSKLLNVRP